MKHKNIFSICIAAVLLTTSFFIFRHDLKIDEPVMDENVSHIKYVKIAGKTLKTELALTPESQSRGLSGRTLLKEDESMLFIFNQAGRYSFWMKDMNFPIDIIWIGEDLRVVYIKGEATPESFPETFVSKKDAKYVLEVESSFSLKNNLQEGDEIEFLSF